MRFFLAIALFAVSFPGSLIAQAPPLGAPPDLSVELGLAPAQPAQAAQPVAAPVTTVNQQAVQGTDGRNTTITETTVESFRPAPVDSQSYGNENDALLFEYKQAYELFQQKKVTEAKDIFKKVAAKSTQDELTANSLFLLANCYLRMGEYENCVKALQTIATKYPQSGIVQKGQLMQFAVNVIDRSSKIQTSWDYWRYQDGTDENNQPVWKESIPPGQQIRRINFRLPFGMYKAIHQTQPNNPYTLQAKMKLDAMLSAPITFTWIDEKAKLTPWGHPSDFFSKLGIREKKHFSEVICERMFYEWKSEKFHLVLKMYDDVRNLKHRYTAKGSVPEEKPQVTKDSTGKEVVVKAGVKTADGIFTLGKLFAAATYDPFTDTFSSATESTQNDLGL